MVTRADNNLDNVRGDLSVALHALTDLTRPHGWAHDYMYTFIQAWRTEQTETATHPADQFIAVKFLHIYISLKCF